MEQPQQAFSPATKRERFAWCLYDFANSGYTTVILTAIFNAYFVGVVAAEKGEGGDGEGTLLWTVAMAIANALVLITAPIIGAIADYSGAKKRFLTISTIGCVLFTALLYFTGPGDVVLAMGLVIVATFMFASGENLIAAFLPEISTPENLYVTASGGVQILSPEGKHLGTIVTPQHVHNMAWGDDDGKTLYLCARTGLYRIRLNIAGVRPIHK